VLFRSLIVDMVLTNTAPTGPYRGAGRPEVNFRVERILDVAAGELGIDPVELRRRNLVTPDQIPFKTFAGQVYDSGDFPHVLDLAMAKADWDGFAKRQQGSEARNLLRGRGLSCHIDTTSGISPRESVIVIARPDGCLEIRSGTQEMGQGLKTTYTQMAAAMMEIAPERIDVVQGDTTLVPEGVGSYGSRSLHVGGSAVVGGVTALIERLKTLAAVHFEVAEKDVELSGGLLRVVGTDRQISIALLASQAGTEGISVDSEVEVPFCFPNGCYICEVEIDPETGTVAVARMTCVDDYGTVINPMIVDGQTQGAVVQGIGQALVEHCVYDPQSGQLLTGSFMDYVMPRADLAPDIQAVQVEGLPTHTNPLGVKGAGESGALGGPPAVVNAVMDALRPFGVTHLDMPIRSEDVWQALNAHVPKSWKGKAP